ncbi:hypothetical protein [Candidatus Protochlamydia phocaeensis]|uniref:hypothetical protein n=1 Tax=Candidatus Protochlamydia phocaeensis TaxID=1414722 RepID=UPI00083836B1|nr:hypothetical protein [Candidatus Protochlamydia phocaeensis]
MINYLVARQIDLWGEYLSNKIENKDIKNILSTIFKVSQAVAAMSVFTLAGAAISPVGASVGFGVGCALVGMHLGAGVLRPFVTSRDVLQKIDTLDQFASLATKTANAIGVTMIASGAGIGPLATAVVGLVMALSSVTVYNDSAAKSYTNRALVF